MTNFKRFATRRIAYAALMTALVYVGTLIGFSSAQFYFNLGDTVILIAAALLDPISAMIAGGLGSFLGDLTVYPATMVFTLIIKGLEGLFAGVFFYLINRLCERLLSKHLSSQFEAFVKTKGERGLTTNATTDLAACDKSDDHAPNESDTSISSESGEQTNDVVVTSSVGGDEKSSESDDERPSESEQDAQNSGEPGKPQNEESSLKNGVFENTSRAKKRIYALKIALSTLACMFCTAFMMTGYFVCQTFFYGTYAAALVALPMDAAQAAISTAAAVILLYPFRLEKLKTKL